MKIKLKTGGLASQCRLAVESMGEANRHVKKKFPPTAQFSRTHSHVTKAMASAKIQTSPLKPAARNTPPMTQSAPHSQATHGCPARVNEYGSVRGNCMVLIIFSPVTMCQPVSESRNSF